MDDSDKIGVFKAKKINNKGQKITLILNSFHSHHELYYIWMFSFSCFSVPLWIILIVEEWEFLK